MLVMLWCVLGRRQFGNTIEVGGGSEVLVPETVVVVPLKAGVDAVVLVVQVVEIVGEVMAVQGGWRRVDVPRQP